MTNITRKRSNDGIRPGEGARAYASYSECESDDLTAAPEGSAWLSGWAFLAAGLGLWLLSHPYWGIWHDARVYTLMALRWLSPSSFARDPWFMFGSQDAFTLFSPLYGTAIALFGIDSAAKWGTLLAGICYVFAAWVFTQNLPLGRVKSLLFLLLVSLQLVYSVNDFGLVESLRLSESFITSRQFSIACALVGIAAAFSGRRNAMTLMLVMSMVLHPLMGLWASIVCVLVLLPIRGRSVLVLAVAAIIAIVALSAGGWGPFQVISGEWALLVRGTARIVFVAQDEAHRLDFVLVCYALLLCGIRRGQQVMQRWYQVVLIVSGSAYLVSWFCSAYFPAAIVMQGQLWRANWLALVFAMVAAVELVASACRSERLMRDMAILSGCLMAISPYAGAILLALLAASPKMFHVYAVNVFREQRAFALNAIRGLSVVAALVVLAQLLMNVHGTGSLLWRVGDTLNPSADFLRGLLFTGGYGLLALIFWAVGCFCRFRSVFFSVSLLILIFGAMQWDARMPQRRLADEQMWGMIDSRSNALFPELIQSSKTVYWQGVPERVWFELRTASYVSSTQAIGIVFSEEMALEIARRLARVSLAGSPVPIPEGVEKSRDEMVRIRNSDTAQRTVDINDLHAYEAQTLTSDGLTFICKDPELDYIIHPRGPENQAIASIKEDRGGRPTRWNLYSCETLRKRVSPMIPNG